jgi:hypothetical protein
VPTTVDFHYLHLPASSISAFSLSVRSAFRYALPFGCGSFSLDALSLRCVLPLDSRDIATIWASVKAHPPTIAIHNSKVSMDTQGNRENARGELMSGNIVGIFFSNELLQNPNTMSWDPRPKLRRFVHHGEIIQCSRLLGIGDHPVFPTARHRRTWCRTSNRHKGR